MWIVRLALRRPYSVAVLSFLLLLFGSLSVFRMRADIFPTIDIPVVIVVWSYPGLPAEDMERRVVIISERAYSTTVGGISKIESQSINGVGILKVYFEPDADIGAAIAQIVSVSLTASRVMPPGIQPPNVIQYNASNVPVAQLTISSPTLSEQQLFDYGLNFIRVRLFTIPGLATPAPYGGKARQIMVEIDPAKVAAAGLSPNDVVQSLLSENVLVPAGSARIGDIDYDVQLNNSPPTVEQFNRMPIRAQNGATVYLGDVARVVDAYAVQQSIVRVDGKRATYLAILKKANASTLAVVDAAREVLPVIKETAPQGMELKIDFDQSVFVRNAIKGVLHEAVISSLLVSIMILVFLGSWRSMVVVITSIPLSIFAALTGLYLTGQTVNIMTLGGLALAIGMLVDDATVEVENIHRNRHMGKPITVAILDGARQIAVPALAATLTICIVFFPVVLLFGPAKHLFTPLAIAVVFAMMASYFLSRTLVPTMARMLLPHEELDLTKARGPIGALNRIREDAFGVLQRFYGGVLAVVLHHRGFVLLCSAAMVGVATLLPKVTGVDFFPAVDAGQMRIHFRAPVGTRIEETEGIIARVEDHIRAIVPPSELGTINAMIGIPTFYNLAFVQTDNIGGQDADVLVSLKSGHRPTREFEHAIRADFAKSFPGSTFYFQPADIINQVLNFGLSAPIDVEVEGMKLEQSYEIARRLRDAIRAIPGTVDVHILQVLDHPALQIDVDRVRAAQLGITQKDVASSMLTSLTSSSLVSPSFWLSPENSVNYIVAVQTPIQQIRTVGDVMATPITGASPQSNIATAPYLGSIASLRPSTAKASINHDSVQRVVDVQCGVDGRDLGGVAGDIDRAIASLGKLPPGTRIHVRGQAESMVSSFKSLGLGLVLAVALVYVLLVVLFQSWLDPFIIMAAVPGALVGVLWLLAITHTSLNVESFMGAIMAVGIAVSNSILLVSFANEVRAANPELEPIQAALEAGRTRLRPVLMTALAMILGMLPMAIGTSEGSEQNAPLGRAVIGGLLVATFVTLFVVPVVYSLLRRAQPRAHELDERFEEEAQGAET